MDARDGNAELEPTVGSRTHATNAASLSTRRGTAAASSRGTTRAVVVSLALHGAIAIALFGTAWGTAWGVSGALREEPPPIVLTADFFQPAPARPTPRASTSNAPSAQRGARRARAAIRRRDIDQRIPCNASRREFRWSRRRKCHESRLRRRCVRFDGRKFPRNRR
jgi:hypothetical protein